MNNNKQKPVKIGATSGTYDPVTNGHMDLIKKSANLCEKLLVIISTGRTKKTIFTEDERVNLLQNEIKKAGIKNAEVRICKPENIIQFMGEQKVGTFFRGVRNEVDIEFENNVLFEKYKDKFAEHNIGVAHIKSDPNLVDVSSTNAKKFINNELELSKIVSADVANALKSKIGG